MDRMRESFYEMISLSGILRALRFGSIVSGAMYFTDTVDLVDYTNWTEKTINTAILIKFSLAAFTIHFIFFRAFKFLLRILFQGWLGNKVQKLRELLNKEIASGIISKRDGIEFSKILGKYVHKYAIKLGIGSVEDIKDINTIKFDEVKAQEGFNEAMNDLYTTLGTLVLGILTISIVWNFFTWWILVIFIVAFFIVLVGMVIILYMFYHIDIFLPFIIRTGKTVMNETMTGDWKKKLPAPRIYETYEERNQEVDFYINQNKNEGNCLINKYEVTISGEKIPFVIEVKDISDDLEIPKYGQRTAFIYLRIPRLKSGELPISENSGWIPITVKHDDNGIYALVEEFIITKRGFRGKGISKLMFEAALKYIQSLNCKYIEGYVTYEDSAQDFLIPYYDRLGFERIAEDKENQYYTYRKMLK